jgi:16S rRNA (uracil1498-N3)-methyltransferase
MGIGDSLRLADGAGRIAGAVIIDDHKKKCAVRIEKIDHEEKPALQHTIAIALVKNNTRFEWFLEKVAELGISRVVPLITSRTEKQHFRFDRMHGILVSAMLQSQQSWLTELSEPVSFRGFIDAQPGFDDKVSAGFIAHCEPGEKQVLQKFGGINSKTILIGPEGDFTPEEISDAIAKGYHPISLGNTRLRTETAGIIAATLAQLVR